MPECRVFKEPLNKSAAAVSGSFAATDRFENFEIHKVFLQFPNLNLETNPLADHSCDLIRGSLKEKFPNGIAVGNNIIKIDRGSQNELTRSEYTERLQRKNRKLRADKFRATDNADEVVNAATDWIDEENRHPRKDDIIQFARGNVLLRIGEKDYTAKVVVTTHKNGKLTLHDLVGIKQTSFQKKEANAYTKNPLPGSDRQNAPAFVSSIRQEGQKSQEVFSKNRASLEEMTDEATDEANRYRWRIELNGRECTVEADTIGSALHEAADALSGAA